MVQLGQQFADELFQGDKIDDVMILVEWAFDGDCSGEIVSVKWFAGVAIVSDEVGRCEYGCGVGNADLVSFRHAADLVDKGMVPFGRVVRFRGISVEVSPPF